VIDQLLGNPVALVTLAVSALGSIWCLIRIYNVPIAGVTLRGALVPVGWFTLRVTR
jgi:hypothetical protein